MKYDVVIIGAGVIGSLCARTLAKYNLKTLVLEKNSDVGAETSAANSAIVHSGYDPTPGTLKAILNVKGNQMYDQIAEELDVPFERIGSLTLAMTPEGNQTLWDLKKRSDLNGVYTEILSRDELLELEPGICEEVTGALLAPTAGIINPFTLTVNAMENAVDNGVSLKLNYEVKKIEKKACFIINDEIEASVVLNCAGVFSDKINELINPKSFTIIPRKGEYVVLDHFKAPFVKHTIFTLPTKAGKGVLISPTTSGNYLIGPSAEEVERDDKSTDALTIANIKAQANKMIKNIPYYEEIRTFAGIRSTPDTHDFIIEESQTKGFINVAGIESPGLASAPAIAERAIEIIKGILNPTINSSFNPYVRKHTVLKHLSMEEKNELVNTNPEYAQIICKCEEVSKAEILDALSRSVPPHSINGLKRRLRTGFGRCQGGMCQSYAIKLMAEYYHVSPKDILFENNGSYILLKETKEAK